MDTVFSNNNVTAGSIEQPLGTKVSKEEICLTLVYFHFKLKLELFFVGETPSPSSKFWFVYT